MPKQNFTPLFKRLKQVLKPYASEFTIRANSDDTFELVGATPKNQAKRFGGVTICQNHVTFYSCPTILEHASPELKEKMGDATASVQLTEVDDALINEIATLTEMRYQNYLATGSF